MEIPGLGPVTEDAEADAYESGPIVVPVLGGGERVVVVEGYDGDDRPEDFHVAIRSFLGLDRSALVAAAPAIFAYYREVKVELGDELDVEIAGPDDVLDHVDLGDQAIVSRDGAGGRVYVSLESECDWEPEHGLQLVFREGAEVTKAGPYDGHLTD